MCLYQPGPGDKLFDKVIKGFDIQQLYSRKVHQLKIVLLDIYGKKNKRASNACVKFFLGWIKSVPKFTLFCRESKLCCELVFWGG